MGGPGHINHRRVWRERFGSCAKNQKTLAGRAGISPSWLSRIESGQCDPTWGPTCVGSRRVSESRWRSFPKWLSLSRTRAAEPFLPRVALPPAAVDLTRFYSRGA